MDWFAQRRKAIIALVGSVASVLLSDGDLIVHDVNVVWPIVAAILTTIVTHQVPNKTE